MSSPLSSSELGLILAFVNPREGNSNWLEIDRGAIIDNASQLLKLTGVRLMAVVKANGYGHGITEVVRVAISAGATYCGVARVEEAFELRRAGIEAPILVLGYTPDEQLTDAIGRNVALTIFHPEQVETLLAAASVAGRPAIVHIKVDTGMSRLGAQPATAYQLLGQLTEAPAVEVEGVFTHFAKADEMDDPTTTLQERRFLDLLAEIEAAGLRPPLVHAANSAAALTRPSTHFDMVRIGIALYGLDPATTVPLPEGYKPALAWKAHLTHVQEYPAGTGVSYGHIYKTRGEERIGVVPVGYGDGYRRVEGNAVLIHGQRVPVVGRVCMDQLMVQLDQIPEAKVGDEVVLLGHQEDEHIRAEEIAKRWETINYEVVCGLGARVPRVYIG
ncbi:MAG: alanine racemase [Anaerolineaceae bacterium]|nr:MAG: alanine racemase [Anaerolineaceae bacterium]